MVKCMWAEVSIIIGVVCLPVMLALPRVSRRLHVCAERKNNVKHDSMDWPFSVGDQQR